jgi:hypothetical protein
MLQPKRMSKHVLFLCLTILSLNALAQDSSKKNEIFLELGGNGLVGSVNYARQLTKKPGLELRAGLGAYGAKPYLTIPVSLNYLIGLGGQHSFLNVGIGATYTKADVTYGLRYELAEGAIYRKSEAVSFVPSFGYRYYTTKDFSWRINFTPVINRHAFFPIFGIGAGKRF